jgi:prepilin-type processing-associated H-X9-DG protein
MRSLVVGLILAVVIILAAGLLTTAVGRMRDKAARTSCANNLHALALAAANSAASNSDCYVQAARPNPSLPFEKRLSWLFELTPYLESGSIYSDVEKDKAWDADENRFAALTKYNWFACPAYPEQSPESTFFPTHFIGLAGIGCNAAQLPKDDPRAGFLGYERKMRFGEFSTSTVVLAMETSQATGAWTAAGPPTVRGLEQDGLPYLGIGGQFGGNHRGVANAVFADGSVRSLRESIDPGVLEAIATIKGRDEVPQMNELGERIDMYAR